MSQNKQTVQKYMDAFTRSDHAEVLSCLTDDVEWETVRNARKDGGLLNAVFCDVFVLQDAKIKHLTSYLMEVQA